MNYLVTKSEMQILSTATLAMAAFAFVFGVMLTLTLVAAFANYKALAATLPPLVLSLLGAVQMWRERSKVIQLIENEMEPCQDTLSDIDMADTA